MIVVVVKGGEREGEEGEGGGGGGVVVVLVGHTVQMNEFTLHHLTAPDLTFDATQSNQIKSDY